VAFPFLRSKVTAQALILGKDLTLENGEILTTRLQDAPLTVRIFPELGRTIWHRALVSGWTSFVQDLELTLDVSKG
jgi:hypothetical protein